MDLSREVSDWVRYCMVKRGERRQTVCERTVRMTSEEIDNGEREACTASKGKRLCTGVREKRCFHTDGTGEISYYVGKERERKKKNERWVTAPYKDTRCSR